jgi:hypothetical protein
LQHGVVIPLEPYERPRVTTGRAGTPADLRNEGDAARAAVSRHGRWSMLSGRREGQEHRARFNGSVPTKRVVIHGADR